MAAEDADAYEYDDSGEEEYEDPGHFDGGYGEGSYFAHAMCKDD